jgi:hypothetical protein
VAAAAGVVLGSVSFVDRMRRALTDLKDNLDVRRESGQHRKLRSWLSLEGLWCILLSHLLVATIQG